MFLQVKEYVFRGPGINPVLETRRMTCVASLSLGIMAAIEVCVILLR